METGQTIGRYEVGERLQGRDYYDLWSASNPAQPSLRVDIKRYSLGELSWQALWREILVSRRLDHPSVPKLRHLVHQGDNVLLVADPRRGKPLLQWLEEQQKLDLTGAAHVLFPLLEVLQHCHARGVLVNELSLEDLNILETGRLQLCALEGATLLDHAEEQTLSPPQHVGLTRHLLAPEFISGEVVDPRADLWRFGALLFELLNGPGTFFDQVLAATMETEGYPGEIGGPPGLQDLYASLMAPDPALRPASAAVTSELLAEVLGKKRWERMVVSPSSGAVAEAVSRPRYCPQCLAALSSGFERHHRCEECGQTWEPETYTCPWCGGPRFTGDFCACCCHASAADEQQEPLEIHPDDLREVQTEKTNPSVDDAELLASLREDPDEPDEEGIDPGPILLTARKRPSPGQELNNSSLQDIIEADAPPSVDTGPQFPIQQRETGPLKPVDIEPPREVVHTGPAGTLDEAPSGPVEPSIQERETGPLDEVPTGNIMAPIQQRETGPLDEVHTGPVMASIQQRETGPLTPVDDEDDETPTGDHPVVRIEDVRCHKCGSSNPRGIEYCMGCGERLVIEQALAIPEPPPEPDDELPEPHRDELLPPDDSPTMVFGREPSGSHEPIQGLVLGEPDAVTLPDLPVGAMLSERWEVIHHLGDGGFARVYLVQDATSYLHRELAVKVPLRRLEADVLERGLLHQYRVWKVLGNQEPNSFTRLERVERLEVDGIPTVGVFVEHMAGGSLLDFLVRPCRDRTTFSRVLRYFHQACLAVEVLHRRELLHRNIKPGNLLLDAKRQRCKVSDFELTISQEGSAMFPRKLLEPGYTAPECEEGEFTVLSDIYSLGATLYHLLGGRIPDLEHPPPLQDLNPLVDDDLALLVARCLAPDPSTRPRDAGELATIIEHEGLTEPGAARAPSTLARLLCAHLPADDLEYLAETLRARGYHMSGAAGGLEDLYTEYCHTEAPREVLAHNCTRPQLARLAGALGLDASPSVDTDELITGVLTAVGFLPGERQLPGIQQTRSTLSQQLHDLTRAGTASECQRLIGAGLLSMERMVGLQVLFYSQVVHGPGGFLRLLDGNGDEERLTLRRKITALGELCLSPPRVPLADRIQRVFRWPLMDAGVLERLDGLIEERRKLRPDMALGEARRAARTLLNMSLEVAGLFMDSPHCPTVVQIVSRHDDLHGRRSFLARDERGHVERIFTPQLLEVGQAYLFYSLTSPACVDPLLFILDLPDS